MNMTLEEAISRPLVLEARVLLVYLLLHDTGMLNVPAIRTELRFTREQMRVAITHLYQNKYVEKLDDTHFRCITTRAP